jgi:ribonuclease PH
MKRADGRSFEDLRTIKAIRAPQKDPDGSVLIQWGDTHVLCSVTVEDKVPNWMNGQNSGWITAEYGMLPGSSGQRIQRDKIRSTGRTHEIQRLIGRSIRASLDLKTLGSRTVQIDCDVIQADGGTRVAAITGSYLALRLALDKASKRKSFPLIQPPLFIAAVSLGKVDGEWILDLNYSEDVKAEVDSNLVMNGKMEFVEVQGTAEKGSFSKEEADRMLTLGSSGIGKIFEFQKRTLQEWGLQV